MLNQKTHFKTVKKFSENLVFSPATDT